MSDANYTPTIESVRDSIAQNKGQMPGIAMWPEANIDDNQMVYDGDLTAGLEGPMFNYVRAVAAFNRFPVSSTLLAMMGAVGVMAPRVIYTMPFFKSKNKRPLTAYVAIGAQSGSGKSTIYNEFFGPINAHTSKREKMIEKKRNALEAKIADIENEKKILKKRHADSNINTIPEYKDLVEEKRQLKGKLDDLVVIRWNMAEYNLQKVATTASQQFGYIPIHSDENDAIDFINGSKAGIETSIMRKSFDGNSFSYGKTDLDLQINSVRAGICLLGQANIAELIWRSSKKVADASNGLMERFLAIIERGVVGRKAQMARGEPPTPDMQKAWDTLVRNIVSMDDGASTTLVFSNKAQAFMDDLHLKYDARCIDGDVFSMEPMLGMVSKSTAHISNIAGILHILKEWCVDFTGQVKPVEVSDDTVKQAARIFSEIVSSHLKIFTSMGVVGVNMRAKEVREAISRIVQSKKKRVFSNSEIQQSAGGRTTFRNGKKLTSSELFETIYPALEADKVLCVVGKKIYINPHFA